MDGVCLLAARLWTADRWRWDLLHAMSAPRRRRQRRRRMIRLGPPRAANRRACGKRLRGTSPSPKRLSQISPGEARRPAPSPAVCPPGGAGACLGSGGWRVASGQWPYPGPLIPAKAGTQFCGRPDRSKQLSRDPTHPASRKPRVPAFAGMSGKRTRLDYARMLPELNLNHSPLAPRPSPLPNPAAVR